MVGPGSAGADQGDRRGHSCLQTEAWAPHSHHGPARLRPPLQQKPGLDRLGAEDAGLSLRTAAPGLLLGPRRPLYKLQTGRRGSHSQHPAPCEVRRLSFLCPPLSTAPARPAAPRHGAWRGNLSFCTRHGWADFLRPHARPRPPRCCPPARCPWGLSIVSIFIPEAVGITARPEIALEIFHVKMTDRSPAPGRPHPCTCRLALDNGEQLDGAGKAPEPDGNNVIPLPPTGRGLCSDAADRSKMCVPAAGCGDAGGNMVA